MKSKRYSAASSPVKMSLFVTGGYNFDAFDEYGHVGRLSTTEYVNADGTITAGPPLPTPRSSHCMVTLSSRYIIILGGHGAENFKSAIIFDTDTNTYNTEVPSMNYNRTYAGCALIKRSPMHNNRPVVLAVGGYGQATAEVYDYTQPNAEWQKSKHIRETGVIRETMNHDLN